MTRPIIRYGKWSVALLAALFVVAQFVPVRRENPAVVSELIAPAPVREILQESCFDCHSHETRWPWYSRIAPLSWWLSGHVQRGRQDLNFSRWPTYDFAGQDLIFHEITRQLKDGTMPPRSYLLGHPAARLDAAERDLLLDWARVADAETWDGAGGPGR